MSKHPGSRFKFDYEGSASECMVVGYRQVGRNIVLTLEVFIDYEEN